MTPTGFSIPLQGNATHDGAASPAVRAWLSFVALVIFVMVLVGGATRLTESGLSIVEWKVVTGTLPPLSDAQWNEAFEAYKKIPQYRQMNAGMSLHEFKSIFWWEWAHRLLGRAIGFFFLLPFLYFLWRGDLRGKLQRRLWIIFGLGALQGAVGWWMVASGLSARVNVSQYRLAIHLTLALIIYGAIIWTVQRMNPRPADADANRAARAAAPPRLRNFAFGVIVLIYVQIYLGALVAGLRAGLIYNTWPGMDGMIVPRWSDLFFMQPWWKNFFEHTFTVQFNHRIGAYLLFMAAIVQVVLTLRARASAMALNGALALAVLVTVQAALGIFTLLYQVPISLALIHQAMGMIVLTVAIWHAGRLISAPPRASSIR